MAEKILNTRIQLKYDTFANWGTHSTVVLKQGEMGICYVPAGTSGLTTSDPAVMFKVGDGVTTFANLPWASGLATDVPDWAKSSTPVVDTNTTYKLVQDATDGHKFSLQSQEKGSSTWNTVTTITIPDNNTSDTNQTIKVGTTTFGADDVVELKAGTNVTLTPDASGKKITITATDTNTTYTFAEGSTDGAFSVTPSGGNAQSVSVHGLGSAAYTASTDYATSGQGTKADNAMPKAGGTFTGEVVLAADPTKTLGAATKQYVDTKVSGLVDSAPNTLDTLNELAAALGDDPNFATTIAGQIGGKVDKVTGKGLSTEDYTTTEKEKLSGIATGATKVESSTTNGKIKINGTETTVYTEVANTVHDANYVHTDNNYTSAEKTKLAGIAEGANNYTHPGTGTNPHGTTKSDVGLENVGNFKAVSTAASQGLTETEKSNARANIGAGTSSLTIGTTSSTAAAGDHSHSNYLTSHQDISGKENTSNKVTSVSSSSTDTQYPSAKCVYDAINVVIFSEEDPVENILNAISESATENFKDIYYVREGLLYQFNLYKSSWNGDFELFYFDLRTRATDDNVNNEAFIYDSIYLDSNDNSWHYNENLEYYTNVPFPFSGTATEGQVLKLNSSLQPEWATVASVTKTSELTNDSGFLTSHQDISNKADLVDGKVPSNQLPSYVDDVIEGYLDNSKFYKESAHTNEITGETGKIYVDLSTNKTYRWSGSAFVVISETLAIGTTASTAAAGNHTHSVTSKSAAGFAPQLPNETTTTKYLRQDGTWQVPPDTNTTYSTATTSANGLMSSADKTKLDGIASNANNYSHPTTTAVAAAAKKVGKDSSGHVVLGDALTAADVGAAASSHTHNYAGSSSAGGAATSANKVNTALTFSNGGSGAASGTTFDGSTARTISYNSIGAAASSHNQAASTITAGTLAGKVMANATAVATVTDAQVRNIIISTSEPTSSDGNDGDIWIVYQ